MRKLILPAALMLSGLLVFANCHNIPSGGDIAHAVIACAEQQQDKLGELAELLAPLLSGQAPDRDKAFELAKESGKELGGCALAWAAQRILSAKGVAIDVGTRSDIADTVEKFRSTQNSGADYDFVIDGQHHRL